MSQAIFISYRRSSASGSAGRLYDTLTARFGDDRVFMDVDSIGPGEHFADLLTRTLDQCRAVLVVIDPDWLTVRNRDGRLRLQDPNDYVRLEVQQALAADTLVFPVLVDGATMPNAEDLPPALRALTGRQATEITATRYRYDAGRLMEAIERVLGPEAQAPVVPAASKQDVQGLGTVPKERSRWRWLRHRWLLLSVCTLLAVSMAIAWTFLQAGTVKWVDLPNLPVALEGAGVATFDDQLWVAGGVSGAEGRQLLDAVNVYDPQTGKWSSAPDLPQPVAFAPLVVADGHLYLLGGQAATGAVATVLKLDRSAGRWLEAEPLPVSREAGAAAWDGSRLVYAGGVGEDHAASSEVFALEGGAWRIIGRLQVAREKAVATSDGFGTIWIIGGRDRNSGIPAYGAVDVVQINRISAGTAIDPVHSSSAAWVPNAGPCLIGGDTGEGVRAEVQCLNGDHDFPPLPWGRAGLGASVLGKDVIVVGGYDSGRHGMASVQKMRPAA